ncbi:MAG: DUF748 domain-containing protein [Candidatus Omnitrophica bacterium]|nr:DUF748 domain-containing protein [Candidatus Omnitrophota bacterium]
MKKWTFVFIFFLLALFHDLLIGWVAGILLEKKLTDLFGMPVQIQGLRVDFFKGCIKASRVTFRNPPDFSQRPHLDIEGLQFDIRWRALCDRRVDIDTVHLNRPFYLIERIPTRETPRNNVKTWYRRIKARKSARPPAGTPSGLKKWQVSVKKFVLHEGTFIFDDVSGRQRRTFVFQKFEGALSDFTWPASPPPSVLKQKVVLQGFFGDQKPAPFWIRGNANFSTSQVSFRLDGEIEEGDLVEQKSLWEGLPVEIQRGTFDLKLRTICLRKQFYSHSYLTLKSVKVAAGSSPTDKIWGMPVSVLLTLLENEKRIYLKVPVHGDISDPQFEFWRAFREAFQESLKQRAQGGIKLIVETPAKLAGQIGKIMPWDNLKIAKSSFLKQPITFPGWKQKSN